MDPSTLYSRHVERLQAEIRSSLLDLESLETQFWSAIDRAGNLRTRIAALVEERGTLTERLSAVEEELKLASGQHDTQRHELDVSRTALDEIRRSRAARCPS